MKTILDFYLSEMTVSDFHGGGITFQRILGEDMGGIGRYIHLSQPTADFPPIADVGSRSSYTERTFFELGATRAVIGCRPSLFLYNMTRASRNARFAKAIAADFNGKRVITGLVCPQGTEAVVALEKLKLEREVEYVTWLMDDHAARWQRGQWRYPAGFKRFFAKHLQEASTVFAISPALAEHYKSEFGVECEILFGPADAQGPPAYEPPSTDGIVRFGYFGRIWKWQLDPLALIARSLDPAKACLHIYGNDPVLPDELRVPGVELKGPLPKEQVISTMRSYDAVIVPASFLEVERNLTEFNIATKMSECLASGTVTLVCGPPYAAMVRYLQGKNAAICFSGGDTMGWPEVMGTIKDPAARRRLLDGAATLAREELSTSVMRARWHRAVSRLDTRHAAT